jgi:hypothetical protein
LLATDNPYRSPSTEIPAPAKPPQQPSALLWIVIVAAVFAGIGGIASLTSLPALTSGLIGAGVGGLLGVFLGLVTWLVGLPTKYKFDLRAETPADDVDSY